MLKSQKVWERTHDLARQVCGGVPLPWETVQEYFDSPEWNDFGTTVLLRSAMSQLIALTLMRERNAYTTEQCQVIRQRLDQMGRSLFAGGGHEFNAEAASNWRGVQYSAAGLCYLAAGNLRGAGRCYERVLNYLDALLGDDSNGWNPEGVGYAVYPWEHIGPFAFYCRSQLGLDIRVDRPAACRQLWAPYVVSMPIWYRRKDEVRRGMCPDFADDHPIWGPCGTANMAFEFAPKEYFLGMSWIYHRTFGRLGDSSFDSDHIGGMFPPPGPEEANPAEVWGLNYLDTGYGTVAFRNRYRDESDTLIQIHAKHRVPKGTHRACDLGSVRMWGLGTCWVCGPGRNGHPSGESTVMGGDPDLGTGFCDSGAIGRLSDVSFDGDGSGSAIVSGTNTGARGNVRKLVVDFSGQSGAEATVLLRDDAMWSGHWRINIPEFHRVTLEPGRFIIESEEGHRLYGTMVHPDKAVFRVGKVERDKNHVGFPYHDQLYRSNQTISCDLPFRQSLAVLTLCKAGQKPPSVSSTGYGAWQQVRVGDCPYDLSE
jgi:hypothetical protein